MIRRGDIYLVNLSPVRANEASDIRPAVVVTNNLANEEGTMLTVVPMTSNTQKIYPFQVLLPLERTELDMDSKAQIEQIRSISHSRLIKRLGFVPDDLMQQIGSRIRLHLAV